MHRKLVILAATLFFCATPVLAMDYGPTPCGPDGLTGPLRHLIPQGVGRADFRPACRRHDASYEVAGANKEQCDRRFLREMQATCRCSGKPIRCRIVARIMFMTTYRFGDDAFKTSQEIAYQGGW